MASAVIPAGGAAGGGGGGGAPAADHMVGLLTSLGVAVGAWFELLDVDDFISYGGTV